MGVDTLQHGELPQAPQFGDSRATGWRPLRLLFGGLALTGALLTFAAVFGSTSASAEESSHDGHSPLGSATSAVAGAVSAIDSRVADVPHSATTAGQAAAARVAAGVPVAARSAIRRSAAVTDAVASAVATSPTASSSAGSSLAGRVAATPPLARIVAPIARAVDTVVSAVPGATAVLGDHPVSTVTDPLTGTVAAVTGLVVGTVNDAVTTVGTSGSDSAAGSGTGPADWTGDGAGEPSGDGTGTGTAALGERLSLGTGAWSSLDSVDLRNAAATCLESGSSAVTIGRAQPMAEPGGAPGGSPGGGPGAQPDFALAPGASSGSGSSGAAGPIVSADTTGADIAAPVGARLSRLPQSDPVPSAPTADHDSSPD